MRCGSSLFCLHCPALGGGACLSAPSHPPPECVPDDAPPLAEPYSRALLCVGGRPSTEDAATRIQSRFRGHRARRSSVPEPPAELAEPAEHEAYLGPYAPSSASCPAGHELSGCLAPGLTRCAVCREFIAEGAFAHECRICRCYLCEGCAGDSLEPLRAGEHVRLCNMRIPMLNCLSATVVQEAGRRRYTVRLATLNDTLTLPLSSIVRAGEEEPDPDDEEGMPCARSSGRSRASTKASMRSLSVVSEAAVKVRETLRRQTFRLVERSVSTAAPLLEAWWAEKKLRAKEQLLDVSAPIRRRALDCVGEFLRQSALRDPDLWDWARPAVQGAVGGLWRDIEAEVEMGFEAAMHRMRAASAASKDLPPPAAAEQPTASEPRCWVLWRLRALLLHHYLPSDRTVFGKMRDPVYLAMLAFTMLPVFGVRFLFFGCILALLVWPGPPDEYQLVQFILHFKGTQFFTSGVIMALVGALQMLFCVMSSREDLGHCFDTTGPGARQMLLGIVADYFGSCVLVWVAFTMLPRSRKHPRLATLQHMSTMQVTGTYCCCLQGVLTQGGRLGRLLRYDVVCFVLSVSVFALEYAAYAVSQGLQESVQAHVTRAKVMVYWGNCLYALLSLPFAFFIIPGLTRLLTHSVITGYNRDGELVEFAYPEVEGCKGV